MPVWYRAALQGTYQGQSIVNVLYYGNDVGAGFAAWSPVVAADLAEALDTTLTADYVASLPSTYTFQNIVVTGIDENAITVSDYEVERVVNEPGGAAVNSEGQAQVAIIAFQTTKLATAGRNVKRSYLAYGPLTDAAQSSDGALEAAFVTGITDLLALLAQTISSLEDYAPVRMGRTVPGAAPAIGRVTGITLRPYASFRKSRKRRPSGL